MYRNWDDNTLWKWWLFRNRKICIKMNYILWMIPSFLCSVPPPVAFLGPMTPPVFKPGPMTLLVFKPEWHLWHRMLQMGKYSPEHFCTMATTSCAVDGCNDWKQQVAERGKDVEDDVIGQDKELWHKCHQNRPDEHVPEAAKLSIRARQHVSINRLINQWMNAAEWQIYQRMTEDPTQRKLVFVSQFLLMSI